MFGFEARGHWTNLSNSHVSLFNSTFTDSTKVQGLGLFTGQVGYAWNAALLYLKGHARMSTRYDVSTTIGGVSLASRQAPVGVEPWASDLSTASHLIGRLVSNTTTFSLVTRTIRSPWGFSVLLRSIGLIRTWIWSPHA